MSSIAQQEPLRTHPLHHLVSSVHKATTVYQKMSHLVTLIQAITLVLPATIVQQEQDVTGNLVLVVLTVPLRSFTSHHSVRNVTLESIVVSYMLLRFQPTVAVVIIVRKV